jgi:CheY-like chemotaxis protein
MIQNASHRAAELVKKLLTFARPVPPDRKLLDIYRPLGDALVLLERTADPRIRRRKNYEDSPLRVNGDYSQLQNAFLNLMINSCHAMPEGGDLSISVRSVELKSPTVGAMGLSLGPGRYAELEIADNGTGIPESIRSRIFEPFFTTREQGEGSGLGLASVFAAVKQHDGSVSVSSTPGRGTVFTILLPLSEEQTVQDEETAENYRTQDGNRVLLVDDEPAVRMAAAGMLKAMNFTILEAENGLQGLEAYRENGKGISLVLLDMTMPEMNGMDCFRELKALEPGVKIILSSGYVMDDDVAQMRSEGLAGFIKKPYSFAELSAEVARVMKS